MKSVSYQLWIFCSCVRDCACSKPLIGSSIRAMSARKPRIPDPTPAAYSSSPLSVAHRAAAALSLDSRMCGNSVWISSSPSSPRILRLQRSASSLEYEQVRMFIGLLLVPMAKGGRAMEV